MGMLFSELKQKDVINICNGKRLGRPFDLLLNEQACVEASLVPAQNGFLGLFRTEKEGLAIPWNHIRRIGDDVILVDMEPDA